MVSAITPFDFIPIKCLKESEDCAQNCGIDVVRLKGPSNLAIQKRIPCDAIQDSTAMREIAAMKQCSHPNIINTSAYDLDYKCRAYRSLYMRYYELGSPDLLICNFRHQTVDIPEEFLWKVLRHMGNAICYLQRGIDGREKAKLGQPVGVNEKVNG